MRAQSISEPPSNDRRSVEPGLYKLLKCQKAVVRRKLRDRNPDLFSAFEIFDHARLLANLVVCGSSIVLPNGSTFLAVKLFADDSSCLSKVKPSG
jgi:hypothetical protein